MDEPSKTFEIFNPSDAFVNEVDCFIRWVGHKLCGIIFTGL